mmetsp:Transcript_15442/g.43208  ORF Transcript_15442/g.43208 Transcript_15442/m.43208 type:complete len:114 (+) Transcript_15442:846-1187(+)
MFSVFGPPHFAQFSSFLQLGAISQGGTLACAATAANATAATIRSIMVGLQPPCETDWADEVASFPGAGLCQQGTGEWQKGAPSTPLLGPSLHRQYLSELRHTPSSGITGIAYQ